MGPPNRRRRTDDLESSLAGDLGADHGLLDLHGDDGLWYRLRNSLTVSLNGHLWQKSATDGLLLQRCSRRMHGLYAVRQSPIRFNRVRGITGASMAHAS